MAEEFETIGLVGKHADAHMRGALEEIAAHLRGRGKRLLLDEATGGLAPGLDIPLASRRSLGERADLVIIVGGDGTMLNVARSLARFDVPLLGVNLGRLGFLTDISPADMAEKLDEVLAGRYQEERRALLHARVEREGEVISQSEAFNDVVVHKWMGARMLELEAHIDGHYVNTHRADGLIVSTPTGSTGYALSGGGPIVHPGLDALVLVPICPHTMSHRPIVVGGDSRVTLRVCETNQADAQVTCDGQINLGLLPEDLVHVEKYPHAARLLHPPGYDYYGMLRAKLHWGQHL